MQPIFFVFGVKIIVNDFFRFRKLETKNSKLVFYVTFPVLGGGRSRAGSESYPPEMIALTVDFFSPPTSSADLQKRFQL